MKTKNRWRSVHVHSTILLPILTRVHRLTWTPTKPRDLGLPVNRTKDLHSDLSGVHSSDGRPRARLKHLLFQFRRLGAKNRQVDKPSNDATEPKPAVRTWRMPHWLFWIALLVFYALSIGPVMKLNRLTGYPGFPPDEFINAFYAPIFYLMDHSKPVGGFYLFYLIFIWRLPYQ
jgi:hypothetical protein